MVRRRSFCRIEMMLLVLCFLMARNSLKAAEAIDLDAVVKDIKEVKGSVQLLVSSQSKDATKVLVFGTTGSCKSTLIYGVAGKDLAVRKVIRVDVSGDDQLYNVPSYVVDVSRDDQRLPGIVISEKGSGTTLPGAWCDEGNGLVFWDCPGFLDTRGPAQDIVNAFSINQLMKPPACIKILLVLQESEIEDSRGQSGARDRLNLLQRLMPQASQLQDSLYLIISKKRGKISAADRVRSSSGIHPLLNFLAAHPERIFCFRHHNEEVGPLLFEDRERLISVLRERNGVINPEYAIALDDHTALSVLPKIQSRFGSVRDLVDILFRTLRTSYDGKDLETIRRWRDFIVTLRSLPLTVLDTSAQFIAAFQEKLPSDAERYREILSGISTSQSFSAFLIKIIGAARLPRMSEFLLPGLQSAERELVLLVDSKEKEEERLKLRKEADLREMRGLGAREEAGRESIARSKEEEYAGIGREEKESREKEASEESERAQVYERVKLRVENLRQGGEVLTSEGFIYAPYFVKCQGSAQRGNVGAQFCLGQMFEYGLGVTKDYREAIRWYSLAAERRHAGAERSLGILYVEGLDIDRSDAKAFQLFTRAAGSGDVEAQTWLGMMYRDGRGTERNEVEAVKWFTLAESRGSTRAQVGLGLLYRDLSGTAQNE